MVYRIRKPEVVANKVPQNVKILRGALWMVFGMLLSLFSLSIFAGDVFLSSVAWLVAPLFLIGMVLVVFLGSAILRHSQVNWMTSRDSLGKEISALNSWHYRNNVDIRKEPGVMFQQHEGRGSISNHISGVINEREFELFNYKLTIDAGKGSNEYEYSVLTFSFKGTFPHIYLNNIHNGYGIFIGEKLPVPHSFEKIFMLSAPRKYEIEALQIFTPDILEKILALEIPYDIELVEQKMIIFINGPIKNAESIEKDINLGLAIIDILGPSLDTFKFHKIGDMSYHLR